MIIYTDGLLEARESNVHGWAHIEWLYPGTRAHQVYRAFIKVQKLIKDLKFVGWLMASERDHTNMHRHIRRVGGVSYAEDNKYIYFKKQVN